MAFSKVPIEAVAPVATPAEPVARLMSVGATAAIKEDTRVKGQVAMNAIKCGYETASRLVLTLAPKPAEAKDLLHTLAAEIAVKIEEYSFRHE